MKKHSTDFGPGFLGGLLHRFAIVCGFWVLAMVGRIGGSTWSGWNTTEVLMLVIPTLLGSVSAFFGNALAKKHRINQQNLRDEFANQVYSVAEGEKVSSFGLYLRGFDTTGLVHHVDENPTFDRFTNELDYESVFTDFETALCEAIEKQIPLVALGRPGEFFGAGRIQTDDIRWEKDFQRLARNADIIFFLPSARPGASWELRQIAASNLIKKTVFVLPPTKVSLSPRKKKTFNWKDGWLDIRKAFSEVDLDLPKYDDGGFLFSFRLADTKENGSVITLLNGSGKNPKLRKRIREHLLEISGARSSTAYE